MARSAVLPLLAVGLAAACTTARTETTTAVSGTPRLIVVATLTPADLARLRWIEGTWRGEGTDQAPFYERYHFTDDSTLVVDSFGDSTLAKVSESSRYELRGGHLANAGEGARWAAVRVDSSSASFIPIASARNSFVWRRDAADRWTALLAWPATTTEPMRERTYHMTRWPR
jgi:hypothetical protein